MKLCKTVSSFGKVILNLNKIDYIESFLKVKVIDRKFEEKLPKLQNCFNKDYLIGLFV